MFEPDSKIIEVSMSDMKIATNPHILRSSGIGSCVVITLYDPIGRIGAMAHSMLPAATQKNAEINAEERRRDQRSSALDSANFSASLRYVEDAIDAMIVELAKLGAPKERMEAKLVGGASMFEVFDKNPNSIGTQNVEAAKKKLEEEGIKVVATDTGENCGRSADFDLTTGIVEVKTKI
ncbi:MAG: chemotaxis protein CheD [Elusimicrobia bacterium]|nr:chemotaxis protein CheD [Patescibacteria group bacterium]MBU4455567.1 chemotaxis protein CheD [Patescibacteria group bacterium]MCG2724848.1 chemotaxis protein CheD [Elusimicrobiota bacterium]